MLKAELQQKYEELQKEFLQLQEENSMLITKQEVYDQQLIKQKDEMATLRSSNMDLLRNQTEQHIENTFQGNPMFQDVYQMFEERNKPEVYDGPTLDDLIGTWSDGPSYGTTTTEATGADAWLAESLGGTEEVPTDTNITLDDISKGW